jgi:hypothetical protein
MTSVHRSAAQAAEQGTDIAQSDRTIGAGSCLSGFQRAAELIKNEGTPTAPW